jgi:hypothetical protein
MEKKSNILKVALFISMTWGGLSCTTNLKSQFYGEPGGNHGYSSNGSFWQFNLKKIDKGY